MATLTTQLQSLLAYTNELTGEAYTRIGDAIRGLVAKDSAWIDNAVSLYGIPRQNLLNALAIDKDIKKTFNGEGRWLYGSNPLVNLGKSQGFFEVCVCGRGDIYDTNVLLAKSSVNSGCWIGTNSSKQWTIGGGISWGSTNNVSSFVVGWYNLTEYVYYNGELVGSRAFASSTEDKDIKIGFPSYPFKIQLKTIIYRETLDGDISAMYIPIIKNGIVMLYDIKNEVYMQTSSGTLYIE